MEKMPGHPRLYRRGATYYHRAAIPVDITNTYPKTEETFSLKTKDHQEAVRLVRVAAAEIDRKFEAHRREQAQLSEPPLQELSAKQIKHIGEVYYAFRLEEDEETRLEGFYDEDETRPELPVPSFEEYEEDSEWLDGLNRQNYARGKIDEFYRSEAEEVLTWDGINHRIEPQSPSWQLVARELQAATIRATEVIRARNQGDVVETPKIAVTTPAADTPPLSAAVEEWAEEKARTRWAAKTEREHRVWMSHYQAIVGDKPLSAYTKEDGRKFKGTLMRLPANWNKLGALKNIGIEQAASKAAELGMPPMSDSNVNKVIGFVASFWSWADKNYDNAPDNPLRGLKLDVKKKPKDDRDPFTDDELRTIFTAPIYTGCESLRQWKQPGNQVLREAGVYWVPLIGLYTGAREGEIIQLYVDDVREEQGVLYFDINADGEDKRIKTLTSYRQIPVHKELIKMGVLEHVALRKSQGQCRLFPDLSMGADGYYSSPFSKHFSRFLISLGIKHKKNSFHSFRHSFEDACRDSGISREVMDALQGHGEGGMSARYGKGYKLKKLNEEQSRLHYRDLDLSHLSLGRVPAVGNDDQRLNPT